jgi:secretory phospholipase A2
MCVASCLTSDCFVCAPLQIKPFSLFTGTKWCGSGNIAANFTDLGSSQEADKCCREHDNCPDSIESWQSKYNLTNNSFYTK